MIALAIQTSAQSQLVDITRQVQEGIHQSGLKDGLCALFVPHTTAGLTFNEDWDPDVRRDHVLTLTEMVPADPRHRHGEGSSLGSSAPQSSARQRGSRWGCLWKAVCPS